jgi:hypothetical protein
MLLVMELREPHAVIWIECRAIYSDIISIKSVYYGKRNAGFKCSYTAATVLPFSAASKC